MTSRPPAVVLGSGLTALGVTRALAREGIPVRHLCPGACDLLEPSRWYRPLVDDPPPGVEEDPGALEELVERRVEGRAVLLPCNDAFVVTVASTSAPFRERHGAHLTDGDVLERLVDKSGLAEIAARAGVPHPRTTPVGSREELEELDADWFRGALLKPVDSLRFFRRFGLKSLPVSSRSEALDAYSHFETSGLEAVLQRYVPGAPSAHLFVDGYRSRPGEMAGLLVRRRERMYPPETGSSSSTVTVPPDHAPGAVESLERLFDAVGFHGIFSAEFKVDAEDGAVRLLEVNVRPWWYVEFASRCGVDVCSMAYRESLGEAVGEPPDYEVGRWCVYAYYDLHAGWSELRAGRLGAREWLRSWIGSDRPIFARDDPMPALRAAWRRARGFVGRRLPRRPSRTGAGAEG